MRRLLLCFVVFLLLPAVSGAQQAMRLPVDVRPLVVHTDKNIIEFDVEIARTDEQRGRGLMFRQDFPAGRVMLFRFPQQQVITMWMMNTPLPLDMVFLNEEGIIVSIHEGAEPFSQAIISSQKPAASVIELKAGQVKEHHIANGQRVTHSAICGACGE
ncbi:MAG: Hypothetical protein BHV28_10190 [Candidatus Tokpelaia hoelldobleri]|uniref:DUF192 domain-containing protein n=1 Tax=Candidatus Tokpelaia hoelldobleri TaxID=1902579 RepID=A0A1U9JV32_9HYPH|nr:MAG: Hypothetical protein BHV28_10190 [Candidatus Tokpelaia hoelldoblerii]